MRVCCFAFLAALCVGVVPFYVAWASDNWKALAPLPDDAAVGPVPNDSSLSPKVAKLLGAWHGEWQRGGALGAFSSGRAGQPTTIIMERIFGRNVQAVLSFGAFGDSKGGWMRILGKIDGDKIVFSVGSEKEKLTLSLAKENSALGEWEGGGYYWQARLDRKTLTPKAPANPQEGSSAPIATEKSSQPPSADN